MPGINVSTFTSDFDRTEYHTQYDTSDRVDFGYLSRLTRVCAELLLEGRRYRAVGRPELAGALWLPALWLVLASTGSLQGNALLLLGVVAVLYTTFCAFAFLRKSS